MAKHHQILIVGGGNAGISAAAQLLRKNSKLDIAIIEPSEKHYYQPAWTLVGGGDFDINATVRRQADVMPKKATWIKDRATGFEPTRNIVMTEKNGEISYKYLIVVPGIQLDWYKVKGLEETLGKNQVASNYLFETAPLTWQFAQNIKAGDKVIFTNPNTPIKCGGAPQKIMYLISDFLRKKGILNKVEVHYYSGSGVIFGVKKYADTLNKVIERYGIKTHFKHNLVEIDGKARKAYFVDENGNRIEQPYDFIHVTPPQSAPDFIKNSPLAVKDNPLGWVDVDKYTLQHNQFPNIFSCGDAANTPNAKTGAAIRKQVPILVKNLLHLINNEPIVDKYNGYGSCPLVTGYGKLVLAEFDYDNKPVETFPFDQSKERWSMYQLKKRILPWLYWNRILKGTA
ncbi:MAG: NAD(P)/FAD-dependent oxidoreductase [Microscillaceae bacterium]|nr:NAD(P)/FAD-dependent oxidoreductase [Microscillaceae bacterium]MDW8461423.1 FAD/NAD(P)-binding oxidoreductase [Cytophagales bacterium]